MLLTGAARPSFDLAATSEWWLAPGQLFDGEAIQKGQAVRISNGAIARVAPVSEAGKDDAPVWSAPDLLLSPGFFDIQVNGGGGVMLNSERTPEAMWAIAAAHRPGGTTAILPTLITDLPDVMDETVGAAIKATGKHGVAGIHLEGPHLAVARKGTHKADYIRPIDERTFSAVERLMAAKVTTMLTLAPETNPPGAVARLVEMGVIVSIGHTAGDAASTRAAIAEGAQSATHLYNAMTPLTSREPGVVGAVLDSDLYAGFIADGHHVDDAVLRLALRSRPKADRMVLVSDAMSTWNGPDSFVLYGETIRVKDGALINQAGSLAGVHIDMANSLKRLVHSIGWPLEDALRMATANPARLMRLENKIGFIRADEPANLVLLDKKLDSAAVLTV